MRKILIAIDKFKGSLSAQDAATAIAAGLDGKAFVKSCPLADGGEGSIEAVKSAVGGTEVQIDTHDPLMRPIHTAYLLYKEHGVCSALIESARVCGLQLLDLEERNPLYTTTYPLGEMILDALNRHVHHIVVALGGSATNDCGTGMLEALGYRFVDANGNALQMCGMKLEDVVRIDGSHADVRLAGCVDFRAACDVTNPLLGQNGATRIYAPQKGADAEAVERLERGMNSFCRVASKQAMAEYTGGGAAGGLGAAMKFFIGAEMVSGWQMMADIVGLEHLIEDCDIVITGEGRVDWQSLNGKLVDGVTMLARKHNKPCWVFCGECVLPIEDLNRYGIDRMFVLSSIEPDLRKSMTDARMLLERLAGTIEFEMND